MLFVIISKRVSNHNEIFNALESAGVDMEGLRNSIINTFNDNMSDDGDDSEDPFAGSDDPDGKEEGRRPSQPRNRKSGKGGHKTLEKFGKNLTELAKEGKSWVFINKELDQTEFSFDEMKINYSNQLCF